MAIYPYLALSDARAAIAFYEQAFDAELFHEVLGEDGRTIIHGRISVCGDVVMLYEYDPVHDIGVLPPDKLGGASSSVRLLVPDAGTVDRFHAQAKRLGARITMEPGLVPWDEYYCRLVDPFGHAWAFGAAVGRESAL